MVERIDLIKNPEEVLKLYEFIKRFPLDYPVVEFFIKRGFCIEGYGNMYTPLKKEIILCKNIQKFCR